MPSVLNKVRRLALVGCGKMGGALLEGWLKLGLDPREVSVFDPHLPERLTRDLKGRGMHVNAEMTASDVVVVAIKPQALDAILPTLKPLIGAQTLVLSVVAGKKISQFAAVLGSATATIRTIPNTPASVGRGITVGVANEAVAPAQRQSTEALLGAVGAFEWIEDEELMDAVTAVSGSGPAYVFHLVEALAEAGIASGLPKPLAEKLARLTVEGAGELLHRSPLSPAVLRQNVTSPGGTTAAALEHLMSETEGFPPLMRQAVAAAARRGRELAG